MHLCGYFTERKSSELQVFPLDNSLLNSPLGASFVLLANSFLAPNMVWEGGKVLAFVVYKRYKRRNRLIYNRPLASLRCLLRLSLIFMAIRIARIADRNDPLATFYRNKAQREIIYGFRKCPSIEVWANANDCLICYKSRCAQKGWKA